VGGQDFVEGIRWVFREERVEWREERRREEGVLVLVLEPVELVVVLG
jgi:hypothetical protein